MKKKCAALFVKEGEFGFRVGAVAAAIFGSRDVTSLSLMLFQHDRVQKHHTNMWRQLRIAVLKLINIMSEDRFVSTSTAV